MATLLVLAAGMGSRYGGLKQLDPVGPSGEVILDYSVYDALAAGFERVVFVIRREFEQEFRRNVASRYEASAEVELAFQDLDDLPPGFDRPAAREKPWGTGHAIWAARKMVREPFVVVNADDFYGRQAFAAMGSLIKRDWSASRDLRIAMVAYSLKNTLSGHGKVSRGICTLDESGGLESVEECTDIERNGERSIVGTDSKGRERRFQGDEMVSMNCWAFTPAIFDELERRMAEFLQRGLHEAKAELYIPAVVSAVIADSGTPVGIWNSTDEWFGITYRDDRDAVSSALDRLTKDGTYPTPLLRA